MSKRSSKKPATDPAARLERAITYWIEHDPIATNEEFKRVAGKHGVRWQDLRDAIRMWQSMKHGK